MRPAVPTHCALVRGARRAGATAATRFERVTADDERLRTFYDSIYLAAFASQREPLDAWQRALRGERPYELTIRLAIDGDVIAGGIAYERYPASACGLVTYMVVAPAYRRAGLGKQLQREAVADLQARGTRAVFGEIDDPRERGKPAHDRLARNQRWGARVVDTRYVQPALGPGLERDRGLILIVLDPPGPTIPGAIVDAFVRELYAATEGGPPDPDVAVPEVVRLVEW
jgi:GNAT superfamily N-acetyltransferase